MFLQKLFPKTFDRFKNQVISEERNRLSQHEHERRLNSQIALAETCVGEKVIYCSNEWQDPIFGTVNSFEIITNSVFLNIKNVLDGEIYTQHVGSVLKADEKMVRAVLKLDPFERWNLTAGKVLCSNMWEKSYQNKEITAPHILLKKLLEVGFI